MNVLEFRTLFNFQLNLQTSFQLSFFYSQRSVKLTHFSADSGSNFLLCGAALLIIKSKHVPCKTTQEAI